MQKPYIFVSYSHKDIEKLDDTFHRLEENYNAWVDRRRLEVGYSFDDEIDAGIKGCYAFLCFQGKNYNSSDYCRREISLAKQLPGVHVIPVFLDQESVTIHTAGATAITPDEPFEKIFSVREIEDCRRLGAKEKEEKMLPPSREGESAKKKSEEQYRSFALPETFSEILLPSLNAKGGKKLWDLVQNPFRMIVLHGSGGAGKSISLKYVWEQCLQKTRIVPMYVSVHDCMDFYGDKEHPLLDYLSERYAQLDQADRLYKWMKGAKDATDQQWLLLVDGYNEASGLDKFRKDMDLLSEVASVIISTRGPEGFENKAGVTLARAMPIDQATVKEYLRTSGSGEVSDTLLAILDNPMLLTMICGRYNGADYDKENIPDNVDSAGAVMEYCLKARVSGLLEENRILLLRVLFPLVFAGLYLSGNMENMSFTLDDFADALQDVLETDDLRTLLRSVDPASLFSDDELRRLWPDAVKPGYTRTQSKEKAAYFRNMDEDTLLDDCEELIQTLQHSFGYLEEKRREQYAWAHQSFMDWQVASGIYLKSLCDPDEFRQICVRLRKEINQPAHDGGYDEALEQSEFLADLMAYHQLTDEAKEYRDLLFDLFIIHEDMKSKRVYPLSKYILDMIGEQWHPETEAERLDYGRKVCTLSFSWMHLNDRKPKDRSLYDILEEANAWLQKGIEAVKDLDSSYEADCVKSQLMTVQGAYHMAKALSKRYADQKNELLEETLRWQLPALEMRRKRLAVTEEYEKRAYLELRIARSYTAIGTSHYYLGDPAGCMTNHDEAFRIRERYSAGTDSFAREGQQRKFENVLRRTGAYMLEKVISRENMLDAMERFALIAENAASYKLYQEQKNTIGSFRRFAAKLFLFLDDEEVVKAAEKAARKLDATDAELFFDDSCSSQKLLEKALHPEGIHFAHDGIGSQQEAINEIFRFVYSEYFLTILQIFDVRLARPDRNEDKATALKRDLERVFDVVKQAWDYRKGGERQAVREEDPGVLPYREEIFRCMRLLGMLDQDELDMEYPEYILPLGGFGRSNDSRCRRAKEVLEQYAAYPIRIISLSSQRPITQELEFHVSQGFAPNAKTEFDLINAGMELHFGLKEVQSHEKHGEEGTKEHWECLRYVSDNPLREYYSLSAPCYDENRIRANTKDTFDHFIKVFSVPENSRILLTSTVLYGPYQTIVLLRIAFRYHLHLYFTGCSYRPYERELLATLCLQDLKSAVEAMHKFVSEPAEQ